MTTVHVVANPYGCPVSFTNCRATFTRLTGCAKDSESLGLTCVMKSGGYAVGVFDNQPATLVHELVHTALFICHTVGINPFASNGEPMAYLTDWLFTQGSKVLKP